MATQREVAYHRPQNLPEAWQALAEMQGAARPVWISPQPPDPADLEVDSFVDLSQLGLNRIERGERHLVLGAGARLRAMQDSGALQEAFSGIIQRAVRKTAHQGLRNLASLGAVLLEPTSAPELAAALLAGDPELVYFDGEEGSRKLVDAWQEGSPFGLPLELRFDIPMVDQSSAEIQWVGRSPMDKAIVTAAVSLVVEAGSISQAQLAVASDGLEPQLLPGAGAKVAGLAPEELERSAFKNWVKSELKPVASYRASADYQLEVATVLAWRALRAAHDEVNQ